MPAVDRIVGYAPAVTVSGNNIVFAPYDLDDVWVAGIATDGSHYLYNVTDNNTKAITGKSGSKSAGYTFTVADSTGWATGELIAPLRQSTGYQYNTIALEQVAASSGDTMLLASGSTTSRAPLGPSTAGTKVQHVWGLFANQQAGIGSANTTATSLLSMTGNLSGQATQVTLQNFRCYQGFYAVHYNDTSGTGGGIRTTRVRFYGCAAGVFIQAGAANSCQTDNCEAIGCDLGFANSVASKFYHCSALFSPAFGFWNNSAASTYTNCYSWGGLSGEWGLTNNSTITYCAASDTTIPAGNGNLQSQTQAQFAFWFNNDNGHSAVTCRILTTSVCYNAGTAIGGITTDIEGNAHGATVPIGCHVGTATPYGVTHPTASNVLSGTGTYVSWTGTQTPSASAEAHTANQVLKSAGGNYNDDNLIAANVRVDKAFGLSLTGTLSPGVTYSSGSPTIHSVVPVVVGATETTIYTCPAGSTAMVRLTLCNTDTSARTCTPHKVLSGETASASNVIKNAIPLAASGSDGDDWVDVARTLEPGDKISALASVAAKVIATIDVILVPIA